MMTITNIKNKGTKTRKRKTMIAIFLHLSMITKNLWV